MRQQIDPASGDLSRLFAPFPRRRSAPTYAGEDAGRKMHHPKRQDSASKTQHRCGQHQRIGRDRFVCNAAQHQMATHRMAHQNMRPGGACDPLRPELSQIIDPDAEIADMPGDRIIAQSARSRLPAPIRCGYLPTRLVPLIERFKIFFIGVSAPREKQDRPARGGACAGPVNPAQRMAIGGGPPAFHCRMGDRAPVHNGPLHIGFDYLANSNLPALVTIW